MLRKMHFLQHDAYSEKSTVLTCHKQMTFKVAIL